MNPGFCPSRDGHVAAYVLTVLEELWTSKVLADSRQGLALGVGPDGADEVVHLGAVQRVELHAGSVGARRDVPVWVWVGPI